MEAAKQEVQGLDAVDPGKKLVLVSSDGKKFDISYTAAQMSVFVKTALEGGACFACVRSLLSG